MKGFTNTNAVLSLDDKMRFGMFQNCTIRDMIEDQLCHFIRFYQLKGLKIDDEAQTLLERRCPRYANCKMCNPK